MPYFWLDGDGYCVYARGRDRSEIFAHRVEAERMLGHPLKGWEQVHHIDGRRWNNCPFNLEVVSRNEHMRLHRKTWIVRRGWACKRHPQTEKNTIRNPMTGATTCRACTNERKRKWRAAGNVG